MLTNVQQIIKREFFIKIINDLKKQSDHDFECAEALEKVFSCNLPWYNNLLLKNGIVELLATIFKDKEHRMIDYFITDGEYGLTDDPLAWELDGTAIYLKDPGMLYDYLIDRYNQQIPTSQS